MYNSDQITRISLLPLLESRGSANRNGRSLKGKQPLPTAFSIYYRVPRYFTFKIPPCSHIDKLNSKVRYVSFLEKNQSPPQSQRTPCLLTKTTSWVGIPCSDSSLMKLESLPRHSLWAEAWCQSLMFGVSYMLSPALCQPVWWQVPRERKDKKKMEKNQVRPFIFKV
jgi:hypothetical protein